jgi:hypothetical protein
MPPTSETRGCPALPLFAHGFLSRFRLGHSKQKRYACEKENISPFSEDEYIKKIAPILKAAA